MKIQILMNNESASDELACEHGLSLFIEYKGKTILFDTGQTGAVMDNMKRMAIPGEDIDYVVLSHGHYDHTGGLEKLIQHMTHPKVVCSRGFWNKKYSKTDTGTIYKGNDFTKDQIESKGVEFIEIDDSVTEVSSGIFIMKDFDRDPHFERIDRKFVVDTEQSGDKFIQDQFEDEIALCFESRQGLVLLVGCAHPGIVNMVRTIKSRTGQKIHALIGGFHMKGCDDEYINEVVEILYEEIVMIVPGHCTGDEAVKGLHKRFNNRFGELLVGTSYIFD